MTGGHRGQGSAQIYPWCPGASRPLLGRMGLSLASPPAPPAAPLTEVGRVVVGGAVQAQPLQVGDQVGDHALEDALALAQDVELGRKEKVRGSVAPGRPPTPPGPPSVSPWSGTRDTHLVKHLEELGTGLVDGADDGAAALGQGFHERHHLETGRAVQTTVQREATRGRGQGAGSRRGGIGMGSPLYPVPLRLRAPFGLTSACAMPGTAATRRTQRTRLWPRGRDKRTDRPRSCGTGHAVEEGAGGRHRVRRGGQRRVLSEAETEERSPGGGDAGQGRRRQKPPIPRMRRARGRKRRA